MKISANEMKVGNVIEHQGKLCVVSRTMHVQPGKGGAYIQAEMKAILEGTKYNERFRTADTVERVHLDEKQYQFLYKDGDSLVFMDQDTFEQVLLDADVLGDSVGFLQDDMLVNLCMYEGKIISADLPQTVVMKIESADPVVKGQTASSSYKPAILENGMKVMVPQHIDSGMKIVVNTSDCTYVERAKE